MDFSISARIRVPCLTSLRRSVTLRPVSGAKHSLRARAQEFHGEAAAAAAEINKGASRTIDHPSRTSSAS